MTLDRAVLLTRTRILMTRVVLHLTVIALRVLLHTILGRLRLMTLVRLLLTILLHINEIVHFVVDIWFCLVYKVNVTKRKRS
jgi:hypothetical protein